MNDFMESYINKDIRKKVLARQIHSEGQELVIKKFATAAAKPSCRFLEVGSWCGDSTIILGEIAKKFNGHLFCVDWWKGNFYTELDYIARENDIFNIFWQRICNAGLEDTVIPIRARSNLIPEVLKENIFDLVFLDADHSYEGILSDINLYKNLLIRENGFLVGHDCEGYLDEYDRNFLEEGKKIDLYESVHCGVILAVNSIFGDNYSLNHNIWAVCSDNGNWRKPDLLFEKNLKKKQTGLASIAESSSFLFKRYSKYVYAIPKSQPELDLTEDEDRNNPSLAKALTLEETGRIVNETPIVNPVYDSSYENYSIYRYNGKYYALYGTDFLYDLKSLCEDELNNYCKWGYCVIDESLPELKNKIEETCTSRGDYKNFRIIEYKNEFFALSPALADKDFLSIGKDQYHRLKKKFSLFSADSLKSLFDLIDYMQMLGLIK